MYLLASTLLTCPFLYLVGPNVNVTWTDSLTAYIAFYHQLHNKRSGIPNAISAMNVAAGLPANTFAVAEGKKMQEEYRKYFIDRLTKHMNRK
jgi:hypothetical protein